MAKLTELAERIPASCSWATGTGTERSFAQIISPYRRGQSWYALAAESEEVALEMAIEEMEAWIRDHAAGARTQNAPDSEKDG